MKVAVFGGTGFIGRNLTQALLDKGYQVYVVQGIAGETIISRVIKCKPFNGNLHFPYHLSVN